MSVRNFIFGLDSREAPSAPVVRIDITRPEGVRYYLQASPTVAQEGKRPLVIILHGGGSSAEQVLGMAFPASPLSVWLEIAEREQVVVIAPNGNSQAGRRAWNDGFADIPSNPSTDDVGFISAIIDRAVVEEAVDANRIYVIGVSKGGMLAYRIAVELAPRLAAFSAVLAAMPERPIYAQPSLPLSFLLVAGTSDPFIPYVGGKFWHTLGFIGRTKSVEASANTWCSLARLSDLPVTHTDGAVVRQVWRSDFTTLQVKLIKIVGGGHAEPSKKKRYPGLFRLFPGIQNGDFELAEEAWSFFKDKRKLNPVP
ncbi:hypothetical protein GTP23_21240 [Pseudoduganella sp. FT93W]|uniref:Phospholipase/carboxylesterase/thioesterase domain-containing protein n=1 Tax=Duganella fentianensis TaxID=2692177 RepID=A0A845I1X6_9BURK|nr:PHB depolymerase family esterase [Duganella fentianensis]MYN47574.1 hypothetical protein [Duganella fentianensis]